MESNHRCRRIRATCFRYNTGPQIGVARIELRCLVLPTHAGHHYPSPRPRGLRPEARDLSKHTRALKPRVSSLKPHSNSSSGSRPPPSAVKGQHPGPIDERAMSFRIPDFEFEDKSVAVAFAPTVAFKIQNPNSEIREWVGWCSNPRLQVFSLALHRLSYRPLQNSTKKARCRCDTGL